MTRKFAGLGSTQHAWCGWPGGEGLPITAPEILVPKPYRAVFIAPHPDDESIGLSGTIARLAMLKRSILLIAATDGSAQRGSAPGERRARSRPRPSRRRGVTPEALLMRAARPYEIVFV